uniref:Ig-like domain-containing protein n=1 Tax=Scophthalmus maximus TaxID=52904 RepID=A0A8D3C3H2_SCOMX
FSTASLHSNRYVTSCVSCEQLSPVQTEEFSVEGRTVTLSYHLSSQVSSDSFFFWYRQHPGKPPEFLVSHTRKGQILNRRVSGLSVTADDSKTQMDLIISSAAVTDSAVYYCALSQYDQYQSRAGVIKDLLMKVAAGESSVLVQVDLG